MSERRIDSEGRDVTDLPGLWCESDRIASKPEPMKIRHTLIKCNSFNDVMRATNQDVSMLVGSATEARQLADWLNQYADWREAQEEK